MNRFRNKSLRDQYAAMVDAYRSRHNGLFTEAGQPHRGSGLALAFWNGFDSVSMGTGFGTKAERSSPAYACWRAGQDCKKLIVVAQAGS
ncbi:hypothetical protein C7U57_28640 [Pseudomonas sp. R9.37]|nr:hypothetical protein C7U57_28640 [Pseudomonas sp. R9.37]